MAGLEMLDTEYVMAFKSGLFGSRRKVFVKALGKENGLKNPNVAIWNINHVTAKSRVKDHSS